MAWWRWSWRTPQACGWNGGDLVTVAHRASIEDVLARLDDAGGGAEPAMVAQIERVRLAALKELCSADTALGLNPVGMARLRWRVVADPEPAVAVVAGLDERRSRLSEGA